MMPDEKTPSSPETFAPLHLVGQSTPSEAPIEATWEDDETTATGILRSLFVLASGGLLLWAQWCAPEAWTGPISQNWSRWVLTSLVFNFVLPLGIVHLFFGQVLVYQDWLKEQKHNAWTYGWNWANWKQHLRISLILWGVMLLPMIYLSRQFSVRAAYSLILPPTNTPLDWLFLIGSLVLYMLCWEWCFRGFGLFGLAQGFGPIAAIAIQAVAFGLAHYGKPDVEMISAFGGGIILGALCWREKSFVPAFFTHTLIHTTWAILVKI